MPKTIAVWSLVAMVVATPVFAATESGGLRERIQQKLELRKDQVQERKSDREEHRAELKDRLQSIKDDRRRAKAEDLTDRMCKLPETRAEAMTRHLQTMSNILKRVSEKGGDNSAVASAVSTAEAAIADAQAAVDALGTGDCVVNITGSEDTLGSEVSAARQALATQLSQVHDKVKAARQAVVKAIQTLARVLGEPKPSPVSEETVNE